MKINKYVDLNGWVKEALDGSTQDKVIKSLNNINKLIYTYEISEKNECSMNPKTEGNIFSGTYIFSSESPNMCIRCRFKFKEKKECNHELLGVSLFHWNGNNFVCTNCKKLKEYTPIINPHMKKARPSYEEAKKIILKFANNNSYLFADALEDLGFLEDE
jgi:hypothetical protein